jgi:hypothetical protein
VQKFYKLRTVSLYEFKKNTVEIESNGTFYISREDYLSDIDKVTKRGRARFCSVKRVQSR